MSRLLFFIAVITAGYLLLKSYRGRERGVQANEQAENMVCCVHCGVHFPLSEGVKSDGNYYCSDTHRRVHQPPPGNPDA